MAIVVTFRIPKSVCAKLVPAYGSPAADALAIKHAMREVVANALERGTEPASDEVPASEPIERINISLKDELAHQVSALAKEQGVAVSIACQRLILGYAKGNAEPPPETVPEGCELLQEVWSKSGLEPRIAQAQVFANIRGAMLGSQVALIEAATGVGKTVAMLLAAEQYLRDQSGVRVAIAVPTIALMAQFANTYEALGRSVPMHPIHAIFGRREFVSRRALVETLKNPKYIDCKDAIEQWIIENGVSQPDSPFEKDWLVSSLKKVAPSFPAAVCCLSDTPDEDDPGYLSYLEQFEHETRHDSEIVLCTHAMLGYSTKQRYWVASRNDDVRKMREREIDLMLAIKAESDKSEKKKLQAALREIEAERIKMGAEVSQHIGKLPAFSFLLIDEAHQLESAMAAASASYLSLRELLRAAEHCHNQGLGITAAKMSALRSGLERLQAVSSFAKGETIALGEESGLGEQVRTILADIHDACCIGRTRKGDLTMADQRRLREVQYGMIVLKAAMNRAAVNQHALVKFSPVKTFPQLYVGAGRVDGLLAHLWGSVAGAACVSATLLLPTPTGHSSHHHRQLLNIPSGRFQDYAPVSPLWLRDAITAVHLPKPESGLCPPSRGDKLTGQAMRDAEREWLSGVAGKVSEIYDSAAGGVLVLMTSYNSIDVLSGLLPSSLRSVAIFGSADATLAEQATAFLKMSVAGKRPIWFATGGAWTGLDIGGHEPLKILLGREPLPPAQDNVLTDVVIPRLPFGLNKSITHEYRVRRHPSTPWEIIDMLFRLKQGVGRLVRRSGLPHNRRVHLLDARIHRPTFTMINERVRGLFAAYPKG